MYEPAYRYGYELGTNERYRGRGWAALEARPAATGKRVTPAPGSASTRSTLWLEQRPHADLGLRTRACACRTRGASPALRAGGEARKEAGHGLAVEARTTKPTLLVMVGAGVLGYKALHRRRAPVGQEHAAVGVWDAPTAHPSRTTSTPAAPPTQTGFLSGLSVKDLPAS